MIIYSDKFFKPEMGLKQVQLIWVRQDSRVMAMEEYSLITKTGASLSDAV